MLRRDLMKAALVATGAAGLARPALAQPARLLRFVPQADLTVIDPVVTTAYITRHHGLMIWDQLYGLDSRLQPQPQMVEGHVVEEDGKRWTFTLRPGLVFHDGTPVRGRDCIASIRRWAQRDALGQTLLSRLAEMTAPEDNRFTIRLTRPFGPMLDALAKVGPPALLIMPERLAAQDPYKPITELIGSGPFRWVPGDRVVGSRVVYERFAGYRPREGGTAEFVAGPKQVHLDRVEWHVMPDPATSAAALQNGEVDWWENPPNDLLPVLRRSREVVTQRINPLGTVGSGVFNHLHPPFDKPAVRRVVMQAASQTDFMTASAGTDRSLWRDDMGFFTPDTPLASTAGLATVPHAAPEALRQALVDAGYKGERVVLMAASDNPVLAALGEVGHDLLRRLGMNVDFVVADWGTVVQRRASKAPPAQGGWNMFHTTWSGLDMVNPAVHQTLRANGDKAYFGWPDIPRIEQLREAWLDAPDLGAQQAIAREIQAVALQEVPYLPTGQYFAQSAWRRDVAGILPGQLVFWNVRKG
jgi:peptide/nickel transport system substrate-binding protein